MATKREMAAIKEIMFEVRSPTVVELGARMGEDEDWIRETCCETAHYVMVEAEIRNCQVIMDKGIHQTRRLILGAVASYSGTAEFWGAMDGDNISGSGSIKKPTKHMQIFPLVEFIEDMHTHVPCWTLDDIFEYEWLSKIDLLWVDVQGAEGDVIAGGKKALSHSRYLFIETEDRELYEGMIFKDRLLEVMKEMNWKLLEDFGYNCLFRNESFCEREPR